MGIELLKAISPENQLEAAYIYVYISVCHRHLIRLILGEEGGKKRVQP